MSIIQEARDAIVGAFVGAGLGGSELTRIRDDFEQAVLESKWTEQQREEFEREAVASGMMKATEGLADLQLAFEDVGWRELTAYFGIWRFNRSRLRQITALARLMFLINPLIKRAVTVQELYVWGSGCEIRGEAPIVHEVLKDFFEDPSNEKIVGMGDEGWPQREREQRIDGNMFYAFFTNRRTGAVRVRLLPYDLVEDVIYNPDDSKEVWFYRRTLANLSGAALDVDNSISAPTSPDEPTGTVLYPDIIYNPVKKPGVMSGTALKIDWNVRVLHIKTGGLSTMKFGMPEVYSALNWATAYKRILENFATILAAYARLAMKMTGMQGKKGIAAAKSKLNTAVNGGQFTDTNPPGNTASWMMLSGNVDVQPVKTAHSTTAPDEARALRSMVASGVDLPEHFFGDSDVGSFATSETLDRPTELKMISRQNFWRQIILKMSCFVIQASAQATNGKLRQAGYTGELVRDAFDGSMLRCKVTPPASGSLEVVVKFPNITERAVTERVRAVVNAVTLNGRKAEGIIPDRRLVAKLLLEALGERGSEDLAAKLYPTETPQGFIDPSQVMKNETTSADAEMLKAEAAMLTAKTKSEQPTPEPKPAAPVGEAAPPPFSLIIPPLASALQPSTQTMMPASVILETVTKEVVGPKKVRIAKRDAQGLIVEASVDGFERTLTVTRNDSGQIESLKKSDDAPLPSNQ